MGLDGSPVDPDTASMSYTETWGRMDEDGKVVVIAERLRKALVDNGFNPKNACPDSLIWQGWRLRDLSQRKPHSSTQMTAKSWNNIFNRKKKRNSTSCSQALRGMN